MYNLLSDKLDAFEKEIRKARNKIFGKTTTFFFSIAHRCFKVSRPYIHTDLLKKFKENLLSMSTDVDSELEIRRKLSGGTGTQQLIQNSEKIVRDSSVLNGDTLKGLTGGN